MDESYFPAEENRYFSHIGPFLGTIEVNLAIANACLPALRPLFKKWIPGTLTSDSKPYAYPTASSRRQTGHSQRRRGPGNSYAIALKSISSTRQAHTQCRSISPAGSEREIMTYDGIMRKTDVEVQYGEANSTDWASQRSSDREHLPEYNPKPLP